MDCSPPDSSVHGISQATVLEWGCHFLVQGIFPTQGSNLHLLQWQVASLPLIHQGSQDQISVQFSSVSQSCPAKNTHLNYAGQGDSDFPDENTGVSCHAILRGVSQPRVEPTPPAAPALQADSYPLNHRLYIAVCIFQGFPSGVVNKESVCNTGDSGRHQYDPWVGMIPWRRA